MAFSLAPVFASGMVLQRDLPIYVFGEGEGQLTLTLGGDSVRTAAADGRFTAELPARSEACGLTLTVTDGKSTLTLTDIMVGEVWLACGQSNMEFLLAYDANREEAFSAPADPWLRFYEQEKVFYDGQEQREDLSQYNKWRGTDAADLPYWSAVGYWFARELRRRYPDLPIGIVACNLGGCTASAWIEESVLRNDSALRVYTDEYDEACAALPAAQYENIFYTYRDFVGSPECAAIFHEMWSGNTDITEPPMPPHGYLDAARPGTLLSHMLSKLLPLSVRGVLWYQGESDEAHADIYDRLLTVMIERWRALFSRKLPFLIVQLAPYYHWMTYYGVNYPTVRAAQEQVAKTVEEVYMTSIMDVGMEWDIHPKQKKPVGERLALLAAGRVYGEDIVCEPPEVCSVIRKGNTVTLTFANTGGALELRGDTVEGLEVFSNGMHEPYSARVEGDRLTVECPACDELRFAWLPYVKVNLYGSSGLPAKPFKLSV